LKIAPRTSTVARLRAEHRAVLGAVAQRRPAEAADLVRAHIEGFYAEARVG